MAEEAASGLGLVRFWGFTPAVDMLKLLENASGTHQEQQQTQDEALPSAGSFTVVLFALADIHHIIWTAQATNAADTNALKVRFIVAEESAEAAARIILLLYILTDEALSIRERVGLYLDVYGNAFVKEQTALYIHRAATSLENFVCGEGIPRMSELVDLSLTKNRRRDDLLTVFRGWRRFVPFQVEKLRDHRLRHFYGERFDYRANLIDWNYQNHIQPYAPLVHWRQYKRFAMTGQAFDLGTSIGLEPNRTLAGYAKGRDKKEGTNVNVRGFWADVVSGPFYSLGVTVEAPFAEQAFRIVSQQQRHNTQEVFELNLTAALFRLVHGKNLTLPPVSSATDRYPYPSLVELALGKENEEDRAREAQEGDSAAQEAGKSDNSKESSCSPSEGDSNSSNSGSTNKHDNSIDCSDSGCSTKYNSSSYRSDSISGSCSSSSKITNPSTQYGSETVNSNEKSPDESSTEKVEGSCESPHRSYKGWKGVHVSIALGPLDDILRHSRIKGIADACVLGWGVAGHLLLSSAACCNETGASKVSSFSAAPSPSAPQGPDTAAVACPLRPLLKPGGVVVLESLKFVGHIAAKSKVKFRRLIAEAATKRGWTLLSRGEPKEKEGEGNGAEKTAEEVTEKKAQEEEKRAPSEICFLTGR